jgi:hypothetical protein
VDGRGKFNIVRAKKDLHEKRFWSCTAGRSAPIRRDDFEPWNANHY